VKRFRFVVAIAYDMNPEAVPAMMAKILQVFVQHRA
jgi:hypothetical protein